MAFTLETFYQVGPGGNGPRIWMYTTPDAALPVITANYFLPVIDQVQVNDVFMLVTSADSSPQLIWSYCIQNDGTTIDLVDGLLIPSANTS